MSKEFTKQDLLTLFDQTVKFKKTLYFESGKLKFPIIASGTVARVCLIEDVDGKKSITLMIDDDYQAFDRSMFDYHLEVVEPSFITTDN